MFTRPDNGKVNKGDLHCKYRAKGVKHTICNVYFHIKLIDEHSTENEDRNQINNKAISAPGANHIEVLQSACN